MCQRLAIIDAGRIVASGTAADLKNEIGEDTISLSIEGSAHDPASVEHARVIIRGIQGVTHVLDSDGGLVANAKNECNVIANIVRALDDSGIKLSSITFSSPTLDDVFLHHTGKRIRAEELGKMPDQRMFRRR